MIARARSRAATWLTPVMCAIWLAFCALLAVVHIGGRIYQVTYGVSVWSPDQPMPPLKLSTSVAIDLFGLPVPDQIAWLIHPLFSIPPLLAITAVVPCWWLFVYWRQQRIRGRGAFPVITSRRRK